MFRETDMKDRVLHESFTKKPLPTLQLLSQINRFDPGEPLSARNSNPVGAVIEAVPTTWDTMYDPTHPDADWGGLVSLKNNQKKHSTNHVSQRSGIEPTENGLASKEIKQEWAHRRPGEDRNKGSIILGGDCLENDPNRFKTSYMSFEEREQTSREQMSFDKRANTKRAILDPAQTNRITGNNNNSNNNKALQTFKQQEFSSATKSLMSGLADSLIDRIPDHKPSTIRNNNLSNNRSMIVENYNPTPGYTGARRTHF
eukprot:gene15027-20218_t